MAPRASLSWIINEGWGGAHHKSATQTKGLGGAGARGSSGDVDDDEEKEEDDDEDGYEDHNHDLDLCSSRLCLLKLFV